MRFRLREIRTIRPDQPILLEIHAAAVNDQDQMKRLPSELDAMNMHLTYDDFGIVQSRLFELVTVRPDYLKFDIYMIRHLDIAPAQHRKNLHRGGPLEELKHEHSKSAQHLQ